MRIGGSRVVFAGLSWPIISGISAGVIALILLIGFSMNAKATGFIDEVFAELHKSTWPNANETFRTTVAVTIMVGLAALVLAAMDWFWGVVFRAIL